MSDLTSSAKLRYSVDRRTPYETIRLASFTKRPDADTYLKQLLERPSAGSDTEFRLVCHSAAGKSLIWHGNTEAPPLRFRDNKFTR
jgi:hypothetical protein